MWSCLEGSRLAHFLCDVPADGVGSSAKVARPSNDEAKGCCAAFSFPVSFLATPGEGLDIPIGLVSPGTLRAQHQQFFRRFGTRSGLPLAEDGGDCVTVLVDGALATSSSPHVRSEVPPGPLAATFLTCLMNDAGTTVDTTKSSSDCSGTTIVELFLEHRRRESLQLSFASSRVACDTPVGSSRAPPSDTFPLFDITIRPTDSDADVARALDAIATAVHAVVSGDNRPSSLGPCPVSYAVLEIDSLEGGGARLGWTYFRFCFGALVEEVPSPLVPRGILHWALCKHQTVVLDCGEGEESSAASVTRALPLDAEADSVLRIVTMLALLRDDILANCLVTSPSSVAQTAFALFSRKTTSTTPDDIDQYFQSLQARAKRQVKQLMIENDLNDIVVWTNEEADAYLLSLAAVCTALREWLVALWRARVAEAMTSPLPPRRADAVAADSLTPLLGTRAAAITASVDTVDLRQQGDTSLRRPGADRGTVLSLSPTPSASRHADTPEKVVPFPETPSAAGVSAPLQLSPSPLAPRDPREPHRALEATEGQQEHSTDDGKATLDVPPCDAAAQRPSARANTLSLSEQLQHWKQEAEHLKSLVLGIPVPPAATSVANWPSPSASPTVETAAGDVAGLGPDSSSPLPRRQLTIQAPPDTPTSPEGTIMCLSFSTPSQLRSARKQRRSAAEHYSPFALSSRGTPPLKLHSESGGGGRGGGSSPFDVSTSSWTMALASPPLHMWHMSSSKLCHAQALRRLMIERAEAHASRDLMLDFSNQSVRLSSKFVRWSVRPFYDSVRMLLDGWFRQISTALDERNEQLSRELAKVAGSTSASSNAVDHHEQHLGSSAPLPPTAPQWFPPAPPLIPSFTLDASDASPVPSNLLLSSYSPTPKPSTRRSTSRTHRMSLPPTTGTSILSSRPETVQAILSSGRNLKGEQRKASGDKVPNLKSEQIRAEAAGWKQSQLDEYKAFAAYHVILLGDSHTGKSSLIACLTSRAPKLFRKPPTVVTPTLEVQRTRIVVPLTKAQGSSAVVPLGGYPKLTMVEGSRVCRESAGSKEPSAIPSNGSSNLSVHILLGEVPTTILRASAPHALPRKGALYVLVFRLTDDVEVSRMAILRHAQHVIALTCADIALIEGFGSSDSSSSSSNCHCIPFVLIGTHADAVGELRNEQDLTAAQRVLASFREWLEEEFKSLSAQARGMLAPQLVDSFAVSCSLWTVAGDRPRSADTFQGMLIDWASFLLLQSPTSPEHFLPSVQTLLERMSCEGPFSDDDPAPDSEPASAPGVASESTPTDHSAQGSSNRFGLPRRDVAPALVDYFWARRGGGSQSGGLFATSTQHASGLSGSTGGGVSTTWQASRSQSTTAVAQRWLHSASLGVITLFTALQRFHDFSGFLIDAAMFDNIVLQHLDLACRAQDERSLSPRLIRLRDILVEEFLLECRRRALIGRIVVEHRAYEIVVLGTQWNDALLSAIFLPQTIQFAASMPMNAPPVRQQFSNVGPRNIVALLNRAMADGFDFTVGSMPLELASYRCGHVSRKMLFHVLPQPFATLASSQRHIEALFAAIGVSRLALVVDGANDGSSPPTDEAHGATRSLNQSFGSLSAASSSAFECVRMSAYASSVFLPCVSSFLPTTVTTLLDDMLHLLGDTIVAAAFQVDVPFASLFARVQSRLFSEAVVGNIRRECHSGVAGGLDADSLNTEFAALSAKNAFASTWNDSSWLLVVALGGLEHECTFSEFRVVVAKWPEGKHDTDATHTPTAGRRCATGESIVSSVFQCFREEINAYVGTLQRVCGVSMPDGHVAEKCLVEPWSETVQRCSSIEPPEAAEALSFALRGMLERTVAPSLKELLKLLRLC